MPKNNEKQNIDISQIQTDISWIKQDISDIKNNHLRSIYRQLETQKMWLIGVLVSVIMLLLTTILKK